MIYYGIIYDILLHESIALELCEHQFMSLRAVKVTSIASARGLETKKRYEIFCSALDFS